MQVSATVSLSPPILMILTTVVAYGLAASGVLPRSYAFMHFLVMQLSRLLVDMHMRRLFLAPRA